jgi:hypothetical protein
VTRVSVLFLHLCVVLVSASGVLLGWARFLAQPDDPYAIAGHPLQPTFQHAHVLTAPLLVFAVGLIWRAHVVCKLRNGLPARRRTGLLLAIIFVLMAATGYVLQVATAELLREVTSWSHAILGTLWVVVYVAHLLLPAATVGLRDDRESLVEGRRPGGPARRPAAQPTGVSSST